MNLIRLSTVLICLLNLSLWSYSQETGSVSTILLDPIDSKRDRKVPIKVYLSGGDFPKPVILFSHGLGGSRDNNPYLGNHWAKNGYVGVFLQHIGSDRSVWENEKPLNRLNALKGATGLKPTLDRLKDIPFVIDQLKNWNQQEGHQLQGKLDLEHIGLAGHSYGAATTLGLTDRKFGRSRTYHDSRISAFLPMSPQPGKTGSPETFFGEVAVPVLCMTGTEDGSPINKQLKPSDRRKVYQAFPPGDKYQLVLEGAQHHAFGDSGSILKKRSRNPNHHPTIQTISTRFWDAYLKRNEAAKKWLQSNTPREACSLDPKDIWEWK